MDRAEPLCVLVVARVWYRITTLCVSARASLFAVARLQQPRRLHIRSCDRVHR